MAPSSGGWWVLTLLACLGFVSSQTVPNSSAVIVLPDPPDWRARTPTFEWYLRGRLAAACSNGYIPDDPVIPMQYATLNGSILALGIGAPCEVCPSTEAHVLGRRNLCSPSHSPQFSPRDQSTLLIPLTTFAGGQRRIRRWMQWGWSSRSAALRACVIFRQRRR